MRVLVTRPEPDAIHTAALLAGLGHEPVFAPLIELRFLPGPDVDLTGVQALLATSSNGVRALSRRSRGRDLPVFAVGQQTRATALGEGFASVVSADGDSSALANLVHRSLKPEAGVLLHVTAREAPAVLCRTLSDFGFEVRTEVLYETPAVQTLPKSAELGIRTGTIDAVLLFSARTAEVFRMRVGDAGLSQYCSGIRAICISRTAADALKGLAFRQLSIASAPNQEALLAALGRGG